MSLPNGVSRIGDGSPIRVKRVHSHGGGKGGLAQDVRAWEEQGGLLLSGHSSIVDVRLVTNKGTGSKRKHIKNNRR